MSKHAVVTDKLYTGKQWISKCIVLIETGIIADIIELPLSWTV